MPAPSMANSPVSHCETDGGPARDASARVIMRTMTRASLAVLMSGVVFIAATGAAASPPADQAPSPATTTAQDRFPETTGKAALLKVCSNCHTAESVVQSLRTRQEWSDVVDQMSRYGAEASDQEFDQILAYLVKHFSPIRINKATAKDLESDARRTGQRGGSHRRVPDRKGRLQDRRRREEGARTRGRQDRRSEGAPGLLTRARGVLHHATPSAESGGPATLPGVADLASTA